MKLPHDALLTLLQHAPRAAHHEAVDGIAAAVPFFERVAAALVLERRAANTAGKGEEQGNAASRGTLSAVGELRVRPEYVD